MAKLKSVLFVDPEENVIIGSQNIMRYMRWKSIVTLYDWVELYGFPAIKTPSGKWLTTMTAIDQWVMLAAEVDRQNRGRSRGTNARADIAKKRVAARFADDSIQMQWARLREFISASKTQDEAEQKRDERELDNAE